MTEENTIRLNIVLPIPTSEALDECLPQGMKSKVMRRLIDMFIEKAEKDGYKAMADLLEGRMQLTVHNVDTPAPYRGDR